MEADDPARQLHPQGAVRTPDGARQPTSGAALGHRCVSYSTKLPTIPPLASFGHFYVLIASPTRPHSPFGCAVHVSIPTFTPTARSTKPTGPGGLGSQRNAPPGTPIVARIALLTRPGLKKRAPPESARGPVRRDPRGRPPSRRRTHGTLLPENRPPGLAEDGPQFSGKTHAFRSPSRWATHTALQRSRRPSWFLTRFPGS